MFSAAWSWILPLVGACATFGAVLLTTPPGFRALTDVVFGTPRGPNADAVAYTLGAAASLALATLIVLAVICGALVASVRKQR
jgi:hypothetical protein